jgi:hypothetical protein
MEGVVSNSEAAIRHFQEGITSGKHWYVALLEAIGLWTDETEQVRGQSYRYLIEGEAFDWLLLAERICSAADGLVPENEKYALLFRSKPPLQIPKEEFKNLIGLKKYHQLLNYFYGVTVEQALFQAVREEVRKERRANGWNYRDGEENEAFIRVYDNSEADLFKEFRKARRTPLQSSSSLTELKEFTYWCFKLRVRVCEKARVASDTHKGLEWLKKHNAAL